MYVDKPDWVTHKGEPIFSVDIDCTGTRLLTAGADCCIRVWKLGPILSQAQEADSKVPKALATLSDHCNAVSIARFSPDGKRIASGSDDKQAIVWHLLPGAGKAAFGSKEAPNHENWRPLHMLRGHGMDIADLAWSPNSCQLATASLDNLVIVWDAGSGRQVTTLRGHHGCVKGVAWDPFNHYLATQGESDGVFIWRVDDWSLLTRISLAPDFQSSAGTSFFARPSWSPDGQTLAATNYRLAGVCCSPLIQRNSWKADSQYMGHKVTVGVARFNPRLWYDRKAKGGSAGSERAGGAADDAEACTLCALGAGDRKFTVWSPAHEQPLMVGETFFHGGVADLSWSPDGYTLVACSHDGSVAVCTAQPGELGLPLPDSEVQKLLAHLYGDNRGTGRVLTLGADLLALAAAPDPPPLPLQPGLSKANGTGPGALHASNTLPLSNGATGAAAGAAGAALGSAAGAHLQRLSQRLGAGGGPSLVGAAPDSLALADAALPAAATGPTSNGGGLTRKRTAPAHAAHAPGPPDQGTAAVGGGGGGGGLPGALAVALSGPPPAASPARLGAAPAPSRPAPGPRAAAPAAAASQAQGAAGGGGGLGGSLPLVSPHAPAPPLQQHALLLPQPPVLASLSCQLGRRAAGDAPLPPGLLPGGQGSEVVVVEASNAGRDHRGEVLARLQCSVPGRLLWADHVQGAVVGMAGSLHFSAVSTASGDLLIHSPAGRRLFPPIQLGCAAAFMACDGGSRLLVLGTDARLRVWDVRQAASQLDVSVAPLLANPACKVAVVRLAATGAPVVVLRNHHAYTFHTHMACWMRIADDSAPASQFHSAMAASHGDLGRAQADVAAARRPGDVLAAARQAPDVLHRSARAHLEANVAAALALRSGPEWRRWLLTYVRQLAADEDAARLREVASELLGPLRWSAASHPDDPSAGWNPTCLGIDKRLLLRHEVLREISRSRTPGNQQLVQELLELCKEAEATAQDMAGPLRLAEAPAAAGMPGPGAAPGGEGGQRHGGATGLGFLLGPSGAAGMVR